MGTNLFKNDMPQNKNDKKLREKVISHIRGLAKLDDKYAEYAFGRYAARLDWIKFPTYKEVISGK